MIVDAHKVLLVIGDCEQTCEHLVKKFDAIYSSKKESLHHWSISKESTYSLRSKSRNRISTCDLIIFVMREGNEEEMSLLQSLLSQSGFDIPVVVVGPKRDIAVAKTIVADGAQDYITYDEVEDEIYRAVEYAMQRQTLRSAISQTAKDLKVKERQYHKLIESSDMGIMVLNSKCKILFLNKVSKLYFQSADIIPPTIDPFTLVPQEAQLVLADSTRVTLTYHTTPILWEGKQARLLFFNDMSGVRDTEMSLLQHQAILSEAKLQAEQASRAKSSFLANMSHELRTPLTSISGFAELLLNHQISSEEEDFAAEKILKNSLYLQSLLDELLDISRIESGNAEVEVTDFDPTILSQEVFDLFIDKAKTKNLSFSTIYELPLPKKVKADATRVKQVVVNLVGNAIKYTPHGSVTLTCTYSDDSSTISFTIEDTGMGMSDKEIEMAFEPFVQLGHNSHLTEGIGLGLAITRSIIDLLDAGIEVTSDKNIGTTITVTFPVLCDSPEVFYTQMSQIPSHLSKPTQLVELPTFEGELLLVEDTEDTADLLKLMLSPTGLKIDHASDGYKASHLALEKTYDFILMDVQIAGIDGLSVTRYLRAHKVTTPIVALTAQASKSDVEECLTAGCTAHLAKPFSEAALLQTIGSYLDRKNTVRSQSNNHQRTALAQKYRTNLVGKVLELNELYRNREWTKLAKCAHKLISAELFDLPEVTKLARSLEKAAKNRSDIDFSQYLDELEREVIEV